MQTIRDLLAATRTLLHRPGSQGSLFLLILAMGIFARTWEWGLLPPSLNPDEASNGVDAISLYRYGTDRNGVAYPIKFVSWGGGQDALYGYILIPFVAILGLSPAAVRLPMLIGGILAIPLTYVVANRAWDHRLALLVMFLVAISPWHILSSRWGLEANLFPLVFLAAYAILLCSLARHGLFVVACAVFGLCLYAYGTAYAAVPVFMILLLLILLSYGSIPRRYLMLGASVFAVVAAPIGMLLLVNSFGLPSIRLGPITIPRFPVQARYEAATLIGSRDIPSTLAANVWTGIKILIVQTDGILYNVVEPYGYFYRISFPVALLGAGLLAWRLRRGSGPEGALLLAWLGASLPVAILQSVNFNRFNIVFTPLLLCLAYALAWLDSQVRGILAASVLLLLAAFIAFTAAYHGQGYRRQVDWKFDAGLIPALRFAESLPQGAVCVTDRLNMPYIFALFSEQTSPAEYLATVQYVDPQAPLQQVRSFGRFVFGARSCTDESLFTYVLTADEIPPKLGNRYNYRFFDNFVVYYPKP
jgi:hypothetical protein